MTPEEVIQAYKLRLRSDLDQIEAEHRAHGDRDLADVSNRIHRDIEAIDRMQWRLFSDPNTSYGRRQAELRWAEEDRL